MEADDAGSNGVLYLLLCKVLFPMFYRTFGTVINNVESWQ